MNEFHRWTSIKNKHWTPINPKTDDDFEVLVQHFPQVTFKEIRKELLLTVSKLISILVIVNVFNEIVTNI